MKRTISNFLAALTAMSFVLSMAACSKSGIGASLESNGYRLSSISSNGGYSVRIEKEGERWSTEKGALGVRFDENEFRAGDATYKPYETLEKDGETLVGTGKISSEYGTVIAFSDYYTIYSDGVHVDRTFTVEKAGDDYGFMTKLKWTTDKEDTIADNDWFVPASYYVTGEHDFSEAKTRMYFKGDTITIPAEDVSMLMAAKYSDGHSFTITDVTAGYRENIVDEKPTSTTVLYIDENINMPSISLINEEDGKLSVDHLYPGYTNRGEDVYVWRLLPVKEGLTRTVSSVIRLGEESSYAELLRNSWRNAYEYVGYADKRYNAEDVYEVLIDRIDNSYAATNAWGDIPMYNTDADHYHPDSGFLYRNLEFGALMLKEGRLRGDQSMIDEAWTVVKYQLENDQLENIQMYTPDNPVYKRTLYDGLSSAVEFYLQEKKAAEEGANGAASKEFLEWLLNYIVDKAEKHKGDSSAMALQFYVPLWRYGKEMFVDYEYEALRLLNEIYEACEDYRGFYGGIEESNTYISVAEDYMILLRAFVDAYEIDGQKRWIDKAIVLADYLETYQMIQPFQLNLVGATGAEGKYFTFMGNERFLANGYIFNNTAHNVLDSANTSSVIEYYRLYEYTQDEHYLEFAEAKLYNALIYVNMGDKVGYMDDPVHSSGLGFINEFVANGCNITRLSELGMRGAAHESIIGWNIWQIVSSFQYFKDKYGAILPEGMEFDLTHDLAKNRYATGSGLNAAYAPQKAFDGNDDTAWIPSGDMTAVVDLNEHCDVTSLSISATKEGAKGYVAFSKDGENWSKEAEIVFSGTQGSALTEEIGKTARYMKVRMQSDIPIATIEAFGSPVFYETLSYNATVSSTDNGNVSNCIDAFDYATAWKTEVVEQGVTAIFDLGEVKEIFQTAIKPASISELAYKIEISEDGENYFVYSEQAAGVEKFIFIASKYAQARYVKITLLGSNLETYEISDLKIQGR